MENLLSTQSVTTGGALIAFAISAAFLAYRQRLNSRIKLLQTTPENERARLVEATAQDFGIPLTGLTKNQQMTVVVKIINSRRLFALIGLLIAILIIGAAVIWMLNAEVVRVTENVGPVMMQPGSTRNLDFVQKSTGDVEVLISNIAMDWSGQEAMRDQWEKENKVYTPEIWFNVCSAVESNECRDAQHGNQRGIGGTYRKQLSSGPATVTFFSFSSNPPITLTAKITH